MSLTTCSGNWKFFITYLVEKPDLKLTKLIWQLNLIYMNIKAAYGFKLSHLVCFAAEILIFLNYRDGCTGPQGMLCRIGTLLLPSTC